MNALIDKMYPAVAIGQSNNLEVYWMKRPPDCREKAFIKMMDKQIVIYLLMTNALRPSLNLFQAFRRYKIEGTV